MQKRSWTGLLLAAGLVAAVPAASAFHGFEITGADGMSNASSNGRETPVPSIDALALGDASIRIDGKLDDEGWRDAAPGTGFTMWDPDRGALPSEETVFKVVYDEDAIYFGVACLEKDPSKITAKLSRRDRFSNSDIVSIYVDPYNDKTTGYNFKVNPLGVQEDSYMFNDGDRDQDWDAVWQAETYRDEKGWYAEFRIPFSSIRYRKADSMTWGLQVYRYMHGRGEDTAWVTWDRDTRGFISRFGELRGLSGVPAPRQIEIAPYFVQRSMDPSIEPDGADGENQDRIHNFENIGADLKYGITPDLTLNATIQPDFGQVEADPATLNLSPFETFFSEKRPFFIEGSRFFQHPDFNLFYSRRIGTGDQNTRIRFASKLTGKTVGGVSVAALAAATDLTGDGQAHNLFKSGQRSSRYLVGRFGKEFSGGKNRINVMQTAVLNSGDRAVYGNFLSREAYTTGLDFDLNFHDRVYNVQGSFVGSIVDPEPVDGNPRAGEKKYGTGGALDIRKLGGRIRGGISGRWEGDRLDINDIGFLSAPDEISSSAWLSYRPNPKGEDRVINRGEFNFNLWKNWLYAGRSGYDAVTGDLVWSYGPGHRQGAGTNVNGWMQWRGFQESWMGIEYYPEGSQRYETRGGPLISEPATFGSWIGGQTDSRRTLVLSIDGNHYRDVELNHSTNASLGARWNQTSAVNHEAQISFRNRIDDTQYLETVNLAERPGGIGIGGRSYVFGKIHQQTLDLTLRTNLLFSRNKSLELYMQPFITTGDYTNARELRTPDSYDLVAYAEPGYRAEDFDFRFVSANLNAVYRWEYRPGSTIYLVWAHSRARFDQRRHAPGRPFQNGIGAGSLFSNEPENVLMAKVTYWFAL